MAELFKVKQSDRKFYEENLKEFLPGEIIDIHTHIWLDGFINKDINVKSRSVTWPSLVAKDNSVEDLLETYKLLFPDKKVTPLIFSGCDDNIDISVSNNYVYESAKKYNLPSLLFALPEWSSEEFEMKLISNQFLGAKVYLNFAPSYIPAGEIRIFDFIPNHQLKVLDKYGLILMLHIPRSKRLRDPVNLAQMLEIERKYPNIKLIIAHVGRAYCNEDIGNAFEMLSKTEKMMFDFSANTNQYVFEQLINAIGPKRILFGSDMPILRMRCKRICENEKYINLVPKGLYGDVSNDNNMREIEESQSKDITFMVYEEIYAFKKAAFACGLNLKQIEDIFNNNARELFSMQRFAPIK